MIDGPPDLRADSAARTPRGGILRVSAAGSVCWAISLFGLYGQLQLLGPIMERFGALEGAVGQLYSLENGAFFTTILLASGPLARVSRVRTALLGVLLYVVGNVASAYAGSLDALLLARVLAGVGSGLVGAAGTASAASAIAPERVFAIITVVHNLLLSAQFKALPYVLEEADPSGGYLLMAGAGVVMMPFFFWLLPPRSNGDASEGLVTLLLAAPNRRLAVVALLGIFIYETAQSGVFAFVDQLGIRAGIDKYARGDALSVTGLVGLVGGVFAFWVGRRFGRIWPILIGMGGNVAAAVGLTLCEGAAAYVALNLLWNVAYNFLSPYVMGALAAMDDRGRWAVAGEALWNGGTVPGPWIAGNLVERGGYLPLAGLSLFTGAVCMAMYTVVLRRLQKQEDARGVEEPAVPNLD
jgi:predicted MFS family arabinose efflux permease